MSVFKVPLLPQPQRFSVFLSSVEYIMVVKWNTVSACWIMDLLDVNDAPVLTGIPLVTGADLLAQFEYLEIGGQMIVQTDNLPYAVPTFENLGTTGNLYYLVEDA
jgi:hypothetical protein